MTIGINTGDQTTYNGQAATVVSESAAYITIIDENGERISVPKNSALLHFANNDEELQELIAENKEKIKGFKQDWNIAKDEKWDLISQLGSFWRNLGISRGCTSQLNEDQLAQYNSLVDLKGNAITRMHAASNGVHRTVHETLSALC